MGRSTRVSGRKDVHPGDDQGSERLAQTPPCPSDGSAGNPVEPQTSIHASTPSGCRFQLHWRPERSTAGAHKVCMSDTRCASSSPALASDRPLNSNSNPCNISALNCANCGRQPNAYGTGRHKSRHTCEVLEGHQRSKCLILKCWWRERGGFEPPIGL